jgi:predicted nucleotidyltransferase
MVAKSDIQKFAVDIARLFEPDRIVLFGSHAYGAPGEFSDVDLLLVMNFEGRAVDRATDIWAALRPSFPVDLILRRPDDLARRYRQLDPLLRDALDKGVVLYERDRARVAG